MSDYELVKQFTEESTGRKWSERPIKMSQESVVFLIKMILSELNELAETVTDSPEEALNLVKNCMGVDLHLTKNEMKDDEDVIENQADSLVDIYYYMLNSSSKHGIDLSKVFLEVHEANMRKRDPLTGKFILRESDGKILKPDGWTEPNVKKILFG